MSAVVRQLAECSAEALGSPEAALRTSLDADTGCPRLVQRQLRLEPGARADVPVGGAGELWFVARGSGSLTCSDRTWSLSERAALLVPPGTVSVAGGEGAPLEVVVVVLPESDEPPVTDVVEAHADTSPEERTGDRTFRVLIGGHQGFGRATQFLGNIPPGRAPLHEHTYDEVVMVLEGSGVVHVDGGTWPLAPGTCIYLPPGSKHCLENDGETTLQVLGVFCPGGTPAAKLEHAS